MAVTVSLALYVSGLGVYHSGQVVELNTCDPVAVADPVKTGLGCTMTSTVERTQFVLFAFSQV